MNIPKAIEILDDLAIPGEVLLDSADVDAVKLGIEALKHFKYHRDSNIISFVKQLPGETKD